MKTYIRFLILAVLLSPMCPFVLFPAQVVYAQDGSDAPANQAEDQPNTHVIYLPYVVTGIENHTNETATSPDIPDTDKIYIVRELPEWQPPRANQASPHQVIEYDQETQQETILSLVNSAAPATFADDSQAGSGEGTFFGNEDVAAATLTAPAAWDLGRVDESLYPWRVVTRLEIEHNELPANTVWVCSGILIDPKIVLTRGGCVFDNSENYGWATSIRVIPAYEDGATPYGDARSVSLISVTQWTRDYNFDYDYGLIVLDRPIGGIIGDSNRAGYSWRSDDSFFTTTTFQNPGYPSGGAYNGKVMYSRAGVFSTVETFSVYRAGSSNSMGGSAAIFRASGTDYRVAAIQSHLRGNDVGYTRITEAKFNFIQANINETTPSSTDLVPLRFQSPTSNVTAGSTLNSMSFSLHNYASTAWNSTVTYRIYISTNDLISTSDRPIGTYTYQGNISAKRTATVNVPGTVIPADLRGSYYIGALLSINDVDQNNNNTSGWDAAPITVNSPPPAVFTVAPTTLTFTGVQGGPAPAAQTIRLTFDGVTGTSWSATPSASWLKVDKRNGVGSTTILVSVDTTGLSASVPDGTIQINAPGANPSSRTVTVKLDLTPPKLQLNPTAISLNAILGQSQSEAKTFTVSFSGSVSAPWRAEASVDWLRISPASGTGSTQVTLTPDVLGLPEGTYQGEIFVTVENTAEVESLAVTLDVHRGLGMLAVTPSMLTFSAIVGEANPPSQTVLIDNQTEDALAWTASTNQPWLTVDRAVGQTPNYLGVFVDTQALAPGQYTGQITIVGPDEAARAGNAQLLSQAKVVNVTTIVVDRNESQPILQVTPPLLQFAATVGDSAPAPQSFTIDNVGGGTLNWTVSSDATWLTVEHTQGTNKGQVRVTVNPATLFAGAHAGTITVSAPDAQAGSQSVSVLLMLRQPPTLVVDGSLLVFSATASGDNPSPKTFTVRNSGEGALPWVIDENIPWLSVTNSNGATPSNVQTQVNIQGLAPGVYEGVINVRSEGAAGTPKSITVKLSLQPGPVLALSPQTLYLDMEAGDVKTVDDQIDIKNARRGTLVWQASESIPWLTINNPTGNTPAFTRQKLSLAIDTRQLAPREQPYTGQILVQSDNGEGSPQTVNLVLTVFSKARYCRIPAGGSDYVINTSRVKIWLENVQITPNPAGGCRLSGAIRVNLPQNANFTFNVVGQVDENNKFTAAAGINLDLGIADIGLSLAREFTITDEYGIVSNGGRWKLPSKFGGTEHGFTGEIRIGPNGLMINAARDFDFPNMAIGGFTITNNKGKVEFSTDGKFLLHLSGDIKLAIAGTGTVTTRVTLVLDQRGIRTGSVQNFTIRGLAGLDLDIINAKMEGDRLKVAQARLKVPQAWGGGEVALYGLSIWKDGSVSVSGGKFRLPEIDAGGDAFKLGSLEGQFFSLPGGGYEIQARGKFGMSGVGEAGSCAIWVDVTLQTGANGSSIMQLTSPEDSATVTTDSKSVTQLGPMAQAASQPTLPTGSTVLPTAAPYAPDLLKLKRLVVGLRCHPGWPIGTTGFNFTGVEGTIALGSGIEKINIKVWIESQARFGETAAVMMIPEATIQPKPFAINFRSPVYVLGLKTQDTVVGISARRFHTEMIFDYIVFHAGIGYEAGINSANKFYVQGNGWGEVSVQKGSIYEECVTYPAPTFRDPGRRLTSCLSIPPSDVRLARADAFIDLEGVDVSVNVSGYRATARFEFRSGTLSVRRGILAAMIAPDDIAAARQTWEAVQRGEIAAAHADSRFTFAPTGNVLISLPVTPTIQQVRASADLNSTAYITDYDLNVQSDAVFGMIQPPEGLLALRLFAPDGSEITPNNLPVNVTYQQMVGISETQTIYHVTAAMPGMWQAKVTGDTQNTKFFVFHVANTPPPGVQQVALTAGETPNTLALTWRLLAAEETTHINIYANAGPITKTVAYTDSSGLLISGVTTNFAGVPIAERVASATDGSLQQYVIDLAQLPSGEYTFWIETVSTEAGSRRCYARSNGASCSTETGAVAGWTINNSSTFPSTWDAAITTITDIKVGEMVVAWSHLPHPDLANYLLRIRTTNPLSPTEEVERLYTIGTSQSTADSQYRLSNIEPGQTYRLAIGAQNTNTDQIVWSTEVEVATVQPEFLLSTTKAMTELTAGGQAVSVPLIVDMADALPYPLVFDLDYERLTDGLYVTFSNEVVTASTTAATSPVAQISAADGVSAGRYVVPIIARSGLLEHELNLQIVVNAGASSGMHIYLPIITR